MADVPAGVEVNLSPPWVTYNNKLRYSLGADPQISVGTVFQPPNSDYYVVVVTVTGAQKAQALANIISPEQTFGTTPLYIVVTDSESNLYTQNCGAVSNIYDVASNVITALSGNPYFAQVIVNAAPFDHKLLIVYPIFCSQVIQFYNDDLSNLCQTYSDVAANVFGDVLLSLVCDYFVFYSNDCTDLCAGDSATASDSKADK